MAEWPDIGLTDESVHVPFGSLVVSGGTLTRPNEQTVVPFIAHLEGAHPAGDRNAGAGTWSGHRSALTTAWWWQVEKMTASERIPSCRMLPSVIGTVG